MFRAWSGIEKFLVEGLPRPGIQRFVLLGSGPGSVINADPYYGRLGLGRVDALPGQRHLDGLAANDNGSGGSDLENRRLEVRMGYGFSVLADRYTMPPEC